MSVKETAVKTERPGSGGDYRAAKDVSPAVEGSRSRVSEQAGGLRAAKAVARDRGVSAVTIWRWGRRGWLKLVNVCGRPYVDLASLVEFDRRAAAGEFAKPPVGAARKSAEARAEKEGGQ